MYRVLIRLIAVCSVAFACGDKGGVPDAGLIDAQPPGGTVTMVWSLNEGVNEWDCDDIGAVAVKVVAVPITDIVQGAQFTFDCDALQGTSIELEPATYNLRIELIGTGLQVLGDSISVNGVVITQEQDTLLDPISFEVTRTGTVEFTISAREAGGNCETADPGDGAEIAQFGMWLSDQFNNCLDATFRIPNSVASGGFDEYISDCDSADVVDLTGVDDCIEEDVTITVPDVTSGEARLVIKGYQDGVTNPCYEAAFNFTILGAGAVRDFGERRIARQVENGPCVFPGP